MTALPCQSGKCKSEESFGVISQGILMYLFLSLMLRNLRSTYAANDPTIKVWVGVGLTLKSFIRPCHFLLHTFNYSGKVLNLSTRGNSTDRKRLSIIYNPS